MYKLLSMCIALSMVVFMPLNAKASGGEAEIPEQVWPHEGMFGMYDRAALQRGFQIYRENCSSCHSLKRLSYRNLMDIGFNEDEVKAVAKEYTVIDGPNDEGEMFERPAVPSDRFVSPFPNEQAARYANNGAFPPDMSLLVKARHGGENYIFALLTGYEHAPEGEEMLDGQYWNKYFVGHKMAMAPPLSEGLITYSDGRSASLEQAARDITQFLAWASEPHMEKRKRMGAKVLLYLLLLSTLLYIAKRRIWSDVH